MIPKIKVNPESSTPLYKQLIRQIANAIRSGILSAGELLPSMNDLSASTGISKETVKKTYGVLSDKRLIVPKQGKGFYVADLSMGAHPQVLVLFDKLSIYKQALYNSFAATLGEKADMTILLHNQNLDLFEYYLDTYLDQFDYYVVTPHFPLDEESQRRAVKLISRIHHSKLILLDRLQPGISGNFGAVYQDFENDIYYALTDELDGRMEASALKVITLPTSLYREYIRKGIERFSEEHGIPVEYLDSAPGKVEKGETYVILSSQLDAGLVDLTHRIQEAGLRVGADVRIISYNDFEMNELILGGLTTVSTDFRQMGRLAAEMILNQHLSKVHCDFRMTRRSTF